MSKRSAGRVLIIPKDNYASNVQYAKLDVVKFGKNAYICKKPCIGIEPTDTEYWMLMVEGMDASDIEGLSALLAAKITDPTVKYDGQVLTYNAEEERWEAADSQGGGDDFFVGTQSEWDTLASIEKERFDGKIVNISDDYDDIDTIHEEIIGLSNAKVNNSVISDAYSESKNYVKGDYLIHNNILYKVKGNCKNVTPPNDSYYDVVSVAEELTKNARIASDYLSITNLHNGVGVYGSPTYIVNGKLLTIKMYCYNSLDISNGDTLCKLTLPSSESTIYAMLTPCCIRRGASGSTMASVFFEANGREITLKANGNQQADEYYHIWGIALLN